MSQARLGDTVKVHYTGKLDDGEVFDSSVGGDPLEFRLGDGEIIPGFEQAVLGMEPGQQTTVRIPHQEAYGAYHEEMVQQIDRSAIPQEVQLELGMQLKAVRDGQDPLLLTVVDIEDELVIVDANHPLAGKDLTFDIELLEIA